MCCSTQTRMDLVVTCLVLTLVHLIDGGHPTPSDHFSQTRHYEGFFNNPSHPSWGSVGEQLASSFQVEYSDGTHLVPEAVNPRHVTNELFRGPASKKSVQSRRYTSLFAFFGQLIAKEIVDTNKPCCPREILGIDMNKDPVFTNVTNGADMVLMPYYRADYDKSTGKSIGNPRKQINQATSWMDGSFIYGSSEIWSDSIRKFRDGCFDLDQFGNPPENKRGLPFENYPLPSTHKLQNPKKFWVVGDSGAHENPGLLSLSILFLRYHNRIAMQTKWDNPFWSDQQIFTKTRSKVIATLQSITYYEWLPLLLHRDPPKYHGYEPALSPHIESLFPAAASQWIMTLIPPVLKLKAADECNSSRRGLRLCNSWFDGQSVIQNHTLKDLVKEIVLGMSAQPAEKEDHIITEDLLDYNYGPLHFSRADAVALQIMKARDFGIMTGKLGKLLNLSDKTATMHTFMRHMNISLEHRYSLDKLYGSVGMLDLMAVLLLEKDGRGSAPGETTKTIIEKQLTRLRDSDRFWFENTENDLFTADEIQKIHQTKMHDVINTVFSNSTGNVMVTNVFRVQRGKCRLTVQELDMEPCIPWKTHDYFAGNEFAFIFSWVWLGLFPFVVVGLVYMAHHITKRRNVRRTAGVIRELPMLAQTFSKGSDGVKITTTEWIGPDETRQVIVSLPNDKFSVEIKTVDGGLIRAVDLSCYDIMNVYVCSAAPFMVHLDVPKEYDLVLEFPSTYQVMAFCAQLQSYFSHFSKLLVKHSTTFRAVKKKAVTKVRRRARLEEFFKQVFAQAFEVGDDSTKDHHDVRDVVEFEISKEEFAEALGLKADSSFVSQMFLVADKKNRGSLQFRDLLELVIIMSRGTPDKKLEMLFDMYDMDKNGLMHRKEMTHLVRSLVDMAGSKYTAEQLEHLVNGMYTHAGLSHNGDLTFEDFKTLFDKGPQGNFMEEVSLDWHGLKSSKTAVPTKKMKRPRTLLMDENAKMSGHRRSMSGDFDVSIDMESMLHSRRSMKVRDARRNSSIDPLNHGEYTPATTPSYSRVTTPSEPPPVGIHSPSINRIRFDDRISEKRLSIASVQSFQQDCSQKPALRRTSSLALKSQPTPIMFNLRKARMNKFIHYIENHKREIAILFLFYSICFGLFAERVYHYAVASEDNGVRQTLSYGVCFARGAAECMSFTFSLMLLTMCYNLVKYLRETFLNLYIPFDKNILFHKIIAYTALFFTGVHVVAYGFNYYFLASGPASHACFFDELVFQSDGSIRIAQTLYMTMPGITGVLLIIILTVMVIFASQTARRYMHNAFWMSHKLFIVLYLLMGIHGLQWLTQKPHFFYYFIGPGIMFCADKVLSVSRRKMKLDILEADLLPSNVTRLLFKRPPHFEYKSGMWVRIAIDNLGTHEYHPFTLTSAPSEDTLSLHIRGVGPWTKNLRKCISCCLKEGKPYPKMFVDGPFGSGQQDWYNFEVAVMVGAGIGVTPYASILKDFVNMMKTRNRYRIKCQKVYFIWSTSNQRSFEWLIDILKQVEEVDERDTCSINIFITQFFQRFDLRTSMLYVFEEHAKRIGGCSLFTGLKATTNFGRPNFLEIFTKISDNHLRAKNIGVFSCGPPGLTKGVEGACLKASAETHSLFQHHYENF